MVKGPEAPVRGEPHCVPPHSCVELDKLGFPWMPVPRHLEYLASYHPAFPFHAWLTLYHIQISGRLLALREHTFPFHLLMCICGSTGKTDLYQDPHAVEKRCQMCGWGEGQCSIAVTVHCQQWLWSCHRLDRHPVLSSSCNIGICDSCVPLNCLLLNTRYFSNTSFYLKK